MTKPTERHLQITEIYKSIQGESTHAGLPCVFVRLTGCNLRCTYCDSEFTFTGGTRMTLRAILQRVESFGTRLVEVTGGEPLLQKETVFLIRELLKRKHAVLIETGGAVDISAVPKGAVVILDVKCPGSGMSRYMMWENLKKLKPSDEVKFVVKDQKDFRWALRIIRKYALDSKCTLLMSAAHPDLENSLLAEWILKSKAPVRLNVQLHKLIWDPTERRR